LVFTMLAVALAGLAMRRMSRRGGEPAGTAGGLAGLSG
jgi:hypothetical protein